MMDHGDCKDSDLRMWQEAKTTALWMIPHFTFPPIQAILGAKNEASWYVALQRVNPRFFHQFAIGIPP